MLSVPVPPYHLVRNKTHLLSVCYVLCDRNVSFSAPCSLFSARGILPFQIAQASLAMRHGAECPRARQLVTYQSQINWWTLCQKKQFRVTVVLSCRGI